MCPKPKYGLVLLEDLDLYPGTDQTPRWDRQPSDFYVNQVIMLWGSFNCHPNLISIIDYIEILKS